MEVSLTTLTVVLVCVCFRSTRKEALWLNVFLLDYLQMLRVQHIRTVSKTC